MGSDYRATLRARIDAALQDSMDRCSRCKACDAQVDAVMAILDAEPARLPASQPYDPDALAPLADMPDDEAAAFMQAIGPAAGKATHASDGGNMHPDPGTTPVAAPLIMRTGKTLSQESPFTGGLVTIYRLTPEGQPDVCVGSCPPAEADRIVDAVNRAGLLAAQRDAARAELAEANRALTELMPVGKVTVDREDLRAAAKIVASESWTDANAELGALADRLRAAAGVE